MKTILITGATGFVGTHLTRELLKKDYSVRTLIHQRSGANALSAGVEEVVGDIRDPKTLSQAVKGAKIIFHCAAAHSTRTKEEIEDTNVRGVLNLLEAVRQAGSGRVILMSSINVLGSCELDNATEEMPYQYSHEPHADAKIEAERLAIRYHQEHGLDIIILRPGFIYGRGEPYLPKLAYAISNGKFAYIGSQNNIAPLVHVNDVVRAMLLAAEKPSTKGQIYHITDGSETTVRELVELLATHLHCPKPKKIVPQVFAKIACTACERLHIRSPITRTALRFLGTSRRINITKAKKELGYSPQINLPEGLRDSLNGISQTELQ
jgi:nucleoside-diphosphate-sugar epimerase